MKMKKKANKIYHMNFHTFQYVFFMMYVLIQSAPLQHYHRCLQKPGNCESFIKQ